MELTYERPSPEHDAKIKRVWDLHASNRYNATDAGRKIISLLCNDPMLALVFQAFCFAVFVMHAR